MADDFEDLDEQTDDSSGKYYESDSVQLGVAGASALGYDDGMTPEQRVRMQILQNAVYSFGQSGVPNTQALIERLTAVHKFVTGG